MNVLELNSVKVQGRLKWFDPVKGFGFIVADEYDGDILLHANVLRNFGQTSIAENVHISVVVQETARGGQATEVIEIHAMEGEECSDFEGFVDVGAAAIAAIPLEPARIKWFDRDKGFGFASVYLSDEDVFVHAEVLQRSGFSDIQAGEAVCLRVIDRKIGRMAVEVISWEMARQANA